MKNSKRMKPRRAKSTFEREMRDTAFKREFDTEYQEFALSEIVLQLMEEKHISVRGLAKAAGISPSVIQDIRSGKRTNVTVQNLSKIVTALGGRVSVQIGGKSMSLDPYPSR